MSSAAIAMHAFTVLPGNDTSLQHSQRLSCKAILVLLVPTQLKQMAIACPSYLIPAVQCESVSPQSTLGSLGPDVS